MDKKTSLFAKHLASGAKMVSFAGWQMPLHYGSQLNEHHQVRNDVGVFDVSHMRALDIQGSQAKNFLRQLLANDVQKLNENGKALYSCLLNEQAGVIDDLIVYRLNDNSYRCVVNAAAAEKDTAWMVTHAKAWDVTINIRQDVAILAVQGPQTFDKLAKMWPKQRVAALAELAPFHALVENNWLMARTGYTGEMGIEIILPQDAVEELWDAMLAENIAPIGLAARDSLRLEAGFNLSGTDMDEKVSPDESNLSWTVDLSDATREFIGRKVLENKRREGIKQQLVGIVLLDKGVCRHDMVVKLENAEGEWLRGKLTSGSYSPTLTCGIGLARIPVGQFVNVQLEIRGKNIPAMIIKPPFIRNKKATFTVKGT